MFGEDLILNNLESYPIHILLLLVIVMIWSLVWKGIALWKSARQKQLPWFVAILIINTVGILEILYVFIFSKINFNDFDKGKKQNNKRVQKRKSSRKAKRK